MGNKTDLNARIKLLTQEDKIMNKRDFNLKYNGQSMIFMVFVLYAKTTCYIDEYKVYAFVNKLYHST